MEFWEESIRAFCVDEIVLRERISPYCCHSLLYILNGFNWFPRRQLGHGESFFLQNQVDNSTRHSFIHSHRDINIGNATIQYTKGDKGKACVQDCLAMNQIRMTGPNSSCRLNQHHNTCHVRRIACTTIESTPATTSRT